MKFGKDVIEKLKGFGMKMGALTPKHLEILQALNSLINFAKMKS